MTDAEMEKALDELDRLLNDPDVRMDPARVWLLAGSLSGANIADTPGTAAR
jgi:ribosomal protein L12E/L44/L45/RPP1/RPP2